LSRAGRPWLQGRRSIRLATEVIGHVHNSKYGGGGPVPVRHDLPVADALVRSPGVPTTGIAWSITQVLALVTLALFTAATWGLFKKARWWEPVAIVAAAVGFVALIPFWIAASHAGEANPAFTVLILALGIVGVLVLLRVPSLERWVDGHVLAGR
jgi:hypothetical protein